MSLTPQAPTRAAILALKDEQAVVNEAYVFLDEKRMLLAAELLKQLRLYQQLNAELAVLHAQSKQALQSAVMHHGLDGLQVYPADTCQGAVFKQDSRNFMGVTLVETLPASEDAADVDDETVDAGGAQRAASNPSGKAIYCRQLFSHIVVKSATLAGLSGNLYRLLHEYRLTERRSRALENVILPEIDQNLRDMSLHLEELDLEDAIRIYRQSAARL